MRTRIDVPDFLRFEHLILYSQNTLFNMTKRVAACQTVNSAAASPTRHSRLGQETRETVKRTLPGSYAFYIARTGQQWKASSALALKRFANNTSVSRRLT